MNDQILSLTKQVERVGTDEGARNWLCRFRKDPDALRICLEVLNLAPNAQVEFFCCQTLAYRSKYQDISNEIIKAGVRAYQRAADGGAWFIMSQIALFLVRGCARSGDITHLEDVLPPKTKCPLAVVQALSEEPISTAFPLSSSARSKFLMQYAEIAPKIGQWLRQQTPSNEILRVIASWIKGCRELFDWVPMISSGRNFLHNILDKPPTITDENAYAVLDVLDEVMLCEDDFALPWISDVVSQFIRAGPLSVFGDKLARCLHLIFTHNWLPRSWDAIEAALKAITCATTEQWTIQVLEAINELEDILQEEEKDKVFPELLKAIIRCIGPPSNGEVRDFCFAMLRRWTGSSEHRQKVCEQAAMQCKQQAVQWHELDATLWLFVVIADFNPSVQHVHVPYQVVTTLPTGDALILRTTMCEYISTLDHPSGDALAFVHSCAPYCGSSSALLCAFMECIHNIPKNDPHPSVSLIFDTSLPFNVRSKLAETLPAGHWVDEVVAKSRSGEIEWVRLALLGLCRGPNLLVQNWTLWEESMRNTLPEAVTCITSVLGPMRRTPDEALPIIEKAMPLILEGRHLSAITYLARIFLPRGGPRLKRLFMEVAQRLGQVCAADPELLAKWFELFAILGKNGSPCDTNLVLQNLLPLPKVVCWALQALKWSPPNQTIACAVLAICESPAEKEVCRALATAIKSWKTLSQYLNEEARRIPDIPEKECFLNAVASCDDYSEDLYEEILCTAIEKLQRQLAGLNEGLL